MKLQMSSRTLGLAILASLAIPTAFADEWSSGYVGGNVGSSHASFDDTRISDSLFVPGFDTTSIRNDDSDTGFKLFAGFRFNRYFAIEGGYYNLGRFGFNANTLPPGTLTGNFRVQGANLDLVASLPLGDKFSAFARLGATYGETRDTFTGTGAVEVTDGRFRDRGGNYKAGFGLQYDVTPSFGVRAEAEAYRVDDGLGNNNGNGDKDHVNLYSLGLIYRFGEVTEAPAPVAYTPPPPPPPPVEPPPQPEPVPPPPPEPPKPFRG